MLTRLSVRSAAGVARVSGLLGLPCAPEVAAPMSLVRHFADKPGGEEGAGGAEEPAAEAGVEAAAAAAEGGAPDAAAPAPSGQALVEGLPLGVEPITYDQLAQYSKRQQAYLGLDPEKHKHFLPRLSRAERGSYADEEVVDEFEEELERAPKIPDNAPLYNLRDVAPRIMEPRNAMLDRIKKMRAQGMSIEEVEAAIGIVDEPEQPPRPGAQPILQWHTRLVLAVGVDEPHPANKKAWLRVHLRDLQREAGLSEAALQYIARICGPRYNPRTGQLLLTSEKYGFREDNRRHCMQMLVDLVEEGQRAYPLPASCASSSGSGGSAGEAAVAAGAEGTGPAAAPEAAAA